MYLIFKCTVILSQTPTNDPIWNLYWSEDFDKSYVSSSDWIEKGDRDWRNRHVCPDCTNVAAFSAYRDSLITVFFHPISTPNYMTQIDNNGRICMGTLTPENWRQVTIKVSSANSGGVHIDGTTLSSWQKGIHTNVSNSSALSYGLSLNGDDRFYACASG